MAEISPLSAPVPLSPEPVGLVSTKDQPPLPISRYVGAVKTRKTTLESKETPCKLCWGVSRIRFNNHTVLSEISTSVLYWPRGLLLSMSIDDDSSCTVSVVEERMPIPDSPFERTAQEVSFLTPMHTVPYQDRPVSTRVLDSEHGIEVAFAPSPSNGRLCVFYACTTCRLVSTMSPSSETGRFVTLRVSWIEGTMSNMTMSELS